MSSLINRNIWPSAKVCKVKIEYYISPLYQIKYTMVFANHKGFNDWINKVSNRNKVVTQMLIRYEYPEA